MLINHNYVFPNICPPSSLMTYHVSLRASPMALHLHLHLRFFIRDADADAGLGPSGFNLCKSWMTMNAGSADLPA